MSPQRTALDIVRRMLDVDERRHTHLEGHRTVGRLGWCRICNELNVERREAVADLELLARIIEHAGPDKEDDMPSDATLADAKVLRDREIELLAACTCGYPIDRFRNGSGHADDCPAHALWTARRA